MDFRGEEISQEIENALEAVVAEAMAKNLEMLEAITAKEIPEKTGFETTAEPELMQMYSSPPKDESKYWEWVSEPDFTVYYGASAQANSSDAGAITYEVVLQKKAQDELVEAKNAHSFGSIPEKKAISLNDKEHLEFWKMINRVWMWALYELVGV